MRSGIIKKYFKTLIVLSFLCVSTFVYAEIDSYQPLAPISLPGGGTIGQTSNLSGYLNGLFRLGVGLAGMLAVIMLVVAGIQYLSTDAVFAKEDAKEKISGALGGLLLALLSYVILRTINPQLLRTNIDLRELEGVNFIGRGYDFDGNDMGRYSNPEYNQGDIPPGTGNPLERVYGKASNFGYNDSMDNGFGAPDLDPARGSGVPTNNTYTRGVALPESVMRSALGITAANGDWDGWAAARRAGVRVFGSDGREIGVFPIVDKGPAMWRVAQGVVIDETYAVSQLAGGDGNRSYQIIPNAFPNR